jgi:hypothetical protein
MLFPRSYAAKSHEALGAYGAALASFERFLEILGEDKEHTAEWHRLKALRETNPAVKSELPMATDPSPIATLAAADASSGHSYNRQQAGMCLTLSAPLVQDEAEAKELSGS